MLQRVKELCRYLPGLEGDTRSRCCSQIVICAALVLFRSAFLYVSAVQPALFHGELLLPLFFFFEFACLCSTQFVSVNGVCYGSDGVCYI